MTQMLTVSSPPFPTSSSLTVDPGSAVPQMETVTPRWSTGTAPPTPKNMSDTVNVCAGGGGDGGDGGGIGGGGFPDVPYVQLPAYTWPPPGFSAQFRVALSVESCQKKQAGFSTQAAQQLATSPAGTVVQLNASPRTHVPGFPASQ